MISTESTPLFIVSKESLRGLQGSQSMDLGLADRHIFITGASGGIGLELAKLFLEEGARITCHYNSNSDPLTELREKYPNRLHQVQANVKTENQVVNAVQNAQDTFGPINAIIINHGVWITEEVAVADMSLEQWQHTLDIDLTGSFLFAREFLKQLKPQAEQMDNISITFIGSTAGKFGEANHADYSASKAALMYGMTLSLKNEIIRIHPRGRVNSVAPGWVLTPMAEEALKDKTILNNALQTMAMNKVATPTDIATAVLFLTSERMSGHISGQVLDVNGGMEGRVLHRFT